MPLTSDTRPVPAGEVRPAEGQPETPFLVVDPERVGRNIARLRSRLAGLGTPLRPHVKTAKSLAVARLLFDGEPGPITVSTLREAEAFAGYGYTDILYAVGLAPQKLDRVVALHRAGVDLQVLVDSVAQAEAVAAVTTRTGVRVPALIEVDCDGHRSGLRPDDPTAVRIAETLERGGAEARGVLLHAGGSYHCRSREELVAAAENERASGVRAADRLRAAGFAAPVVSVGSTPTAHAAADLTGVTEVRAGNFVFFDLVMAGIGVCGVDDLAMSVVVTVIGHQPGKGWIVTDGGWMATSRDRGTSGQPVDQGYGLVARLDGPLYPDLVMTDASQEHGILTVRPGSPAALPNLPVGTRVRILPIHACATAAQHDEYLVLDPATGGVTEIWPRLRGW
ncbi:DSD1 family PLP-dependent enzyme [Plantactinospora mayteni]|uniref:Alanine racemase n=1 Tax=Plantactinospora mayteni TaxID=566021 RepID=A0ABQ4EZ71_9ACTN|nr:alanine racemase [Plantactinospora mayteni]GIG99962.1 alanine racemase [Plantactinospora mayteni]